MVANNNYYIYVCVCVCSWSILEVLKVYLHYTKNMIRPMMILHIWFHLLNLMTVIISNIPAELLNNSRITYVMSDWRVIASTVVSILSCDPSINITSWRFCIIVSLVESVINISIVVGYSPGHSSLTYIVFDCNITGA